MGQLSEAEREWLDAQAVTHVAKGKSSQSIIVALREYCLKHGIQATDGELFVVADAARAQKVKPGSGHTAQAQIALPPRSLKDRRIRDRREGPRRRPDRRRTGLEAAVEALRRIGQPDRRLGLDRRASFDRRKVFRRRRIRRTGER